MNAYVNQYQNNQILSSSPEQILILLYDGSIRFCRQAIHAMDAGQRTTLHHHDENDELLSAVYYIRVPENSGNLILHDAGKKISIVEKTTSFTLHTNEFVPVDGLVVSVNDDYGYMVIRVH